MTSTGTGRIKMIQFRRKQIQNETVYEIPCFFRKLLLAALNFNECTVFAAV